MWAQLLQLSELTIFSTTASFPRWLVVYREKENHTEISVAVLLQTNQSGGSPAWTPWDWSHSPDTWSFSTRWPSISCARCDVSRTVSQSISECPQIWRIAEYLSFATSSGMIAVVYPTSWHSFVVTGREVCLSPFLSAPVRAVILFLFVGLYAAHLIEVC
jgi:hypothetical protein